MRMKNQTVLPAIIFWTVISAVCISERSLAIEPSSSGREQLLMDFGWKFAYGHPYDVSRDFNHGSGYFSYLAKAGYGDGPAAAGFDDRSWRPVDLPHDFAVEQPFDQKGSHSHGYKAIGRNFPEVSVGWYRKEFFIPSDDAGRRIVVTFEGVHRDAKVWINGHYLGNEASGYNSFSFDLSACLNYGGNNVLSVRVDVTYEEGWYYEGAGIYRHVWLTKTNPLHVAQNGTFIYNQLKEGRAEMVIETTVSNEQSNPVNFSLKHELIDADGHVVAQTISEGQELGAAAQQMLIREINVEHPRLWSVDDPYLYKVKTTVIGESKVADTYTTVTGIRTIRFDADSGFFLNGKPLKLKGTNNHQDHAGVGTAMPDELLVFRVKKLKEMGSNAIRSSHNPASPALLEVCDRLGMLVIDENRLMGTAPFIKDQLQRMIVRDRNHPSIIAWSLGNEEWAIEGNRIGEQIIPEMQAFASRFDPTRPKNAASSGGWGYGISKSIEVMGFNYLNHGSHEDYHAKFPKTPMIGTEEGSTNTTRGIYFENPERHHLTAYDQATPNGYFFSIEHCWKHYAARDFLSGMFIWTGFDYRGEPTPYGWPSIGSYFGMYDMCGFPKDNVYYLKAWWSKEPVLHLFPHWNWQGKAGDTIRVVAYSNCDETELFVNRKSAGKKTVERNGHVEWAIPYQPGRIQAIGYNKGKKILEETIETTGQPEQLRLEAHQPALSADGRDVAVISVSTLDGKGRFVPTAENKVWFEIEGPGKIIGVGNGDPTCLEADKLVDHYTSVEIENMKVKLVETCENRPEVVEGYDDSDWLPAQKAGREIQGAKAVVWRGTFDLPADLDQAGIKLFYRCIGNNQSVYINGKLIADGLTQKQERPTLVLSGEMIHSGKNEFIVVGTPYRVRNSWDTPNTDPGIIQIYQPAPVYSRSLFSGYAQVIVQATREEGTIRLTAKSEGLQPAEMNLPVKKKENDWSTVD